MRTTYAIAAALPIAAILAAIAYGGRTVTAAPRLDVSSHAPLHEVMQGLFEARLLPPTQAPQPVAGVIVPHHLTAARSIAAGVLALPPSTRTVLLLSPDHFHRCPTLLCTAASGFRTVTGDVDADAGLVRRLSRSALVTDMPELFASEHGVAAVLPFLARERPGTLVVPVVLSQRLQWRRLSGALLSALRPLLAAGAVPVVSSDFSHYLPLAPSERMDRATMMALLPADTEGIAALRNPQQSDCPACLWLLTRLAEDGGFFNPSVLLHTNSAVLLGDPAAPETTSHFAVAYYRDAALGPEDLAVAGDVTMTRGDAPSLPERMRAFWAGAGPRLVNLEGPLSAICGAHANPYVFCNPLARFHTVAALATHWVVENNHMLDLGPFGPAETEALLQKSGERPVGSALADAGSFRAIAVTLVMNDAPEGGAHAWSPRTEEVIERIRSAPAGKPILVYIHGGLENEALPSPAERAALRRFADAGAAAVVQAHSHVPGDMEFYRGVPIISGLGNFLFDQEGTAVSTAVAVRLRPYGSGALVQSMRAR